MPPPAAARQPAGLLLGCLLLHVGGHTGGPALLDLNIINQWARVPKCASDHTGPIMWASPQRLSASLLCELNV